MGNLVVDQNKCNLCGNCVSQCPFGAIRAVAGKIVIHDSCKFCKLCLKKCPASAISLVGPEQSGIDKSLWRGILIYVEHLDGVVHPVTLELIGKARELAARINHPVYALFIGADIGKQADELLKNGVDRILVYDEQPLQYFKVDTYANIFEDCINELKPAIVLVGATAVGRSLAPRVAARFRTGLTADCTQLEVRPDSNLVQIRPAFGGNIMAQIITDRTRPQFATVRYQVMEKVDCLRKVGSEVIRRPVDPQRLHSKLRVLNRVRQDKQVSISDAEVLVVAGRGVKNPGDLGMLEELAGLLGGQLACTRPLVEAGWLPYTRQIGLSGRTVKPKLIITCGVSGAVQFTACMNMAERIYAINNDASAPILKVAHYGIIGDLYQVIPGLTARVKREGKTACHMVK